MNRRIPVRMFGLWHSVCDMPIYKWSGLPMCFGNYARGWRGLAVPNPLDLELHYFAVHVLKGLVSSVMSKLILSDEQ